MSEFPQYAKVRPLTGISGIGIPLSVAITCKNATRCAMACCWNILCGSATEFPLWDMRCEDPGRTRLFSSSLAQQQDFRELKNYASICLKRKILSLAYTIGLSIGCVSVIEDEHFGSLAELTINPCRSEEQNSRCCKREGSQDLNRR